MANWKSSLLKYKEQGKCRDGNEQKEKQRAGGGLHSAGVRSLARRRRSAVQEQPQKGCQQNDEHRVDLESEKPRCNQGDQPMLPVRERGLPEGHGCVSHNSHNDGLKPAENRNHGRKGVRVRVGHGQRQHQEERRQAKPEVAAHRPPHAAEFKADIGRHLHDGRTGNRLAEGDPGVEGVRIEPVFLADNPLADVGDHGGAPEGGQPHAQERGEQKQQRRAAADAGCRVLFQQPASLCLPACPCMWVNVRIRPRGRDRR